MAAGQEVDARLRARFGSRLRASVSLAPFTTFRTGGRADWLLETDRAADLVAATEETRTLGLPLTLLGGGSNVLVGDRGVRGLVVRLRHGRIHAPRPDRVRADAGVTINGLVRWTIQRGLAGLERWAGTPGTVGGAIHGNAHFEGRLVGDMVTTVGLIDEAGDVHEVPADAMAFGYDQSRVQRTREVVAWAEFAVESGMPSALRRAARQSLAFRKRTQPLDRASAGCVFQNPRDDDGPLPPGVPRSAGALIDRAGLKGTREGGAVVSGIHGNFIVNAGGASATEIRTLIERCRDEVARQYGIELRLELVCLGEF